MDLCCLGTIKSDDAKHSIHSILYIKESMDFEEHDVYVLNHV